MKHILMALCALTLSSAALAGDFRLKEEDSSSITVEYTGMVDFNDVARWNTIADYANGRVVFLIINSGGGYAYAGIDLYWVLEAYPNLVTIGGERYGAWSAAAIMWTAGDVRQLENGRGQVWFHAAYCSWDPNANPEIGCDTSDFQLRLIECFEDAGFRGIAFNIWLNVIQGNFGTDGWIGCIGDVDSWYLYDSTDEFTFHFDESEIEA